MMWAFLFPHPRGLTCTRSDLLHLSCLVPGILYNSGHQAIVLTHILCVFVQTTQKNEKTVSQTTRMVVFLALNLNHKFYNLLLSSTWTSSVATSSICCHFSQNWQVVGANCSWRQRAGGLDSWCILECGAQDLFWPPCLSQCRHTQNSTEHGVEGLIGSQNWQRIFFLLRKCGI